MCAIQIAIEGLSFPIAIDPIAIDFNEAGDAFGAINAVGPPGSGAVVAFSGLAAGAMEEMAASAPAQAEADAPEMLPETGADLTESTPVWPAWVFVVMAGVVVGGFVLYRRRVA